MLKLWDRRTGEVFAESCMFAARSRVRLAFAAAEIRRVFNPITGVEYEAGRDWLHTPGSRWLRLAPQSRIPRLDDDDLHPAGSSAILYSAETAERANAVPGGRDGRNVLFNNASFFGRHQIEVDYVAVDPAGFPLFPAAPVGKLPKLRARVASGKGTLRICAIGDSITLGFNATQFVGVKPFQPCYSEMFSDELAEGGLRTSFQNFGINGASSRDFVKIEADCLAAKPDLLIVAYGMNDLLGLTPGEYISVISEIVGRSRAANPGTEYLLVSPMSGNPEWRNTPVVRTKRFAAELRKFAAASGDDVALADVTSAWSEILGRKNFFDMTGNGVNHPNDYGHRLYASVLLAAVR